MSVWTGTYEGRSVSVSVSDPERGPDRSSYIAWKLICEKLDVPIEHRSPDFVKLTRKRG